MNKKNIIVVLILSAVISIFMIVNNSKKDQYVLVDNSKKAEDGLIKKEVQEETEDKSEDVKREKVVVYISGEVLNPQVVEMQEGKRLIDAIKKCGGFTQDADKDRVNLALLLKDEKHYVIPKTGQEIELEDSSHEISDKGEKLININTADAEKLKTLPGIGDKTAQKIIQYRKNFGEFKVIEEIKNVGGIGDKKFEQIESQITV